MGHLKEELGFVGLFAPGAGRRVTGLDAVGEGKGVYRPVLLTGTVPEHGRGETYRSGPTGLGSRGGEPRMK